MQEKQNHLEAEVTDLEGRTRWDTTLRTHESEKEGIQVGDEKKEKGVMGEQSQTRSAFPRISLNCINQPPTALLIKRTYT